MLRQISPGLGRADVMLNSFGSCISNASEKLSGAPKMPMGKVVSQPRMLLHESESRISFEQLQCFANTHGWRQLNKQMHMVDSDVQFVNLASIPNCNFADESFAVNSNPIKLEGIHCIFGLPNQMESILPEGMAETLQIHFFAPKVKASKKAHANFVKFSSRGSTSEPLYANKLKELNFWGGNSSIGLKAEVPLPQM